MDITGKATGLRVDGCNLNITGSDKSIKSTSGYDLILCTSGYNTAKITVSNDIFDAVKIEDLDNLNLNDFDLNDFNFSGLKLTANYTTHLTYNGTLTGNVTLDDRLYNLLSDGDTFTGGCLNDGDVCNLTIDSGATLTIPSDYQLKLDDSLDNAVFKSLTVNGSIVNNGTLYISEEDYNKVTGDGKTIVGGMIEVNGSYYKEGSDITKVGFNFESNDIPTIATCYTAGDGYMLFNPSTDDGYKTNTITLLGASFSGSTGDMEFKMGDITNLVLSGTNSIVANSGTGGASLTSSGDLTVSGTSKSDSLTISGSETSGIKANGTLTVQNCTLTLKDDCNLGGTEGVSISGSSVSMTDGDAVTGISSSGDISIANSTVDIKSKTHGIVIFEDTGNVTINGTGSCNVEVTGNKNYNYNAIFAPGSVTIGGSVSGTISAAGVGIKAGDNSTITLSTTGNLSITSSGARGLYTLSGNITLGRTEGTPAGSITIQGSTEGIRTNGAITANKLSSLSVTSTANTAIHMGGNVTCNGITTMTVSANGDYGIYGDVTTLTDINDLTITNVAGCGINAQSNAVTLTNVSGKIDTTRSLIYAGNADVTINTTETNTSSLALVGGSADDNNDPINCRKLLLEMAQR